MRSHIPNCVFQANNKITRLALRNLPNAQQAVQMYQQDQQGRISENSKFGEDPIQTDNSKLSIRTQAFIERYPSYEQIFFELVNNANPTLFKSGLIFYIDLTYRLSMS